MTIKEIFRRTNLKKICAILIFPIPQPQVESGARRRSEGGNVVERRETERDPFSRVVENFFHFFRPRSRKISARFFEELASWLKFEGIKQAWHEGREKARWWWIRWLPKYRFVSNIFCPGRALKFVEAIKIEKPSLMVEFFSDFCWCAITPEARYVLEILRRTRDNYSQQRVQRGESGNCKI